MAARVLFGTLLLALLPLLGAHSQEVRASTPVMAVAYSGDGKYVAAAISARAMIWNAANGQLLRRLGAGPSVSGVAFSPDGTRVVLDDNDDADIWDVRTGKKVLTCHGKAGSVLPVAYSHDGKRVAGGGKMTVEVWDAHTGHRLTSIRGHTDQVSAVAFSPDGSHVLTGSWDGSAKVWDLKTTKEGPVIRDDASIESVAWSPDGSLIATTGFSGNVRLWNARSGAEVWSRHAHGAGALSVAFSPDGSRVAVGTKAGIGFGKQEEGDAAGGLLRIWDVKTGKQLLVATNPKDGILRIAFSPDGKRVLTGEGDGSVRLLDADTGQELRRLSPATGD